MQSILIVEDEERYQNLYKRIFRYLNVPPERCFFADDFETALRWVQNNANLLQVALIDLKFPKSSNDLMRAAMEEEDSQFPPNLGFDLIRAIRDRNRDCEVVIISNYTDERPERKILAKLRAEGVWVDSVLHKQHDLDMENQGGIDLLRSYVEPIDEALALLELQGIYARHPRLQKIVRRISHVYRNLPAHWPMPAMLFYGSPGAGKNGWARAAACLKAGLNREAIFEEESLGSFPDQIIGDTVGAKLFGARSYNGVDAAGLFEKATRYGNHNPNTLANGNSVPDLQHSGVAFLDELDSAPAGLIDALLNTMSEGQVKTVGVRSTRIKIGCSLIFASIQGTSLLENGHANQYERGAQALEAFFNRILPNHILAIPDLRELGVEFARNFLGFKAGGELSIQPMADDLLVEGVETGRLNMRKLARISVPQRGQARRRLLYDEVQKVFGIVDRKVNLPVSQAVPLSSVAPLLLDEARLWLDGLEAAAQKVAAEGRRVSRKELARIFVSPKTGKAISGQRISQVLGSERLARAFSCLLSSDQGEWPLMRQMLKRLY